MRSKLAKNVSSSGPQHTARFLFDIYKVASPVSIDDQACLITSIQNLTVAETAGVLALIEEIVQIDGIE